MRLLSIVIPILISLLIASCQYPQPPKLSVFKFDGCSCFPEGTPSKPNLWEEDCRIHDLAYWKGGTREQRKQADLKLRDAIRGKADPFTARIAYSGVRIFGSPWLPTPWRWGFGWNDYCRKYQPLGDEEMSQIETTAR